MDRTATCSCGQMHVTMRGDPSVHGLCNCYECQKLSGAPFSYGGYWPKSAIVEMAGETRVWRRTSETNKWVDRYFCPVCGSAVFEYLEFAPDMIAIGLGHFADKDFPPPKYSVWNENKHPWVTVPEGCQNYDQQPTEESEKDAWRAES